MTEKEIMQSEYHRRWEEKQALYEEAMPVAASMNMSPVADVAAICSILNLSYTGRKVYNGKCWNETVSDTILKVVNMLLRNISLDEITTDQLNSEFVGGMIDRLVEEASEENEQNQMIGKAFYGSCFVGIDFAIRYAAQETDQVDEQLLKIVIEMFERFLEMTIEFTARAQDLKKNE